MLCLFYVIKYNSNRCQISTNRKGSENNSSRFQSLPEGVLCFSYIREANNSRFQYLLTGDAPHILHHERQQQQISVFTNKRSSSLSKSWRTTALYSRYPVAGNPPRSMNVHVRLHTKEQ
jgi:hypothetical protein